MSKTLTRVGVILLPLLVALGLVAIQPEVAHGATREDNCVKTREFLHAPWASKDKVEEFWGTGPGRHSRHVEPLSPGRVAYDYPTCNDGWVSVVYRKRSLQAVEMYAEGL